MIYTETLVASPADRDELLRLAQAGRAGGALVGRSRSPGRVRYLVAEVSAQAASLAARAHSEGLGLLDLLPNGELLLRMAGARQTHWPLGALCCSDHSIRMEANATTYAAPDRLQRHQAALGTAGQQRLGNARIAVVGCGGTGSMVALLLAQAGIGRIALVDHDCVEQSNRNRLAYAIDRDVARGSLKVRALQRFLRGVAPDVAAATCPFSVYDPRSTAAVLAADVLVGCTDNEGSRLHMNALAVQHFVPFVDCGVGIERSADQLVMGGQVRVVLPGGPCLECYGGIDRWLAGRDFDAALETALAHRYGLAAHESPASIAFLNAVIAAEAVASVLALLTGLRPAHPFIFYDAVAARLSPRAVLRAQECLACGHGQRYGRGESLPLPVPEFHC